MSTPSEVKKRVAVMISGRGSNLQALVEAAARPNFPAMISLVVSNRPEAKGLEFATESGIATEVVRPVDFLSDTAAYETAVHQRLESHQIDIVCLAGFMRILSPVLVSPWYGRLLNIHPSLLPAYPGLHTHARVLADRATVTGCTVHFVTPELDAGPPIYQGVVSTAGVSDPEELAERVLAAEHRIYPRALAAVASGRVTMHQGRSVWHA